MNSLSPHLLISSWYLNWYNPIRSQREGERDDTVGKGQPPRTHTGWRRIESDSRNVIRRYLAFIKSTLITANNVTFVRELTEDIAPKSSFSLVGTKKKKKEETKRKRKEKKQNKNQLKESKGKGKKN